MSGRGAYYKAKYGGGRGGRGGGRGGGEAEAPHVFERAATARSTRASGDDLLQLLRRIDQKAYGAYKDLYGQVFEMTSPKPECLPYSLEVVYVQGDPYAAPSRVRVRIPLEVCDYPKEWYASRVRSVALCDYLQRSFVAAARSERADVKEGGHGWGGAKGGQIKMDEPGQHVLQRSGVQIVNDAGAGGFLESRFQLGLPASGRSIEGKWCAQLLLEMVPLLVSRAFLRSSLDSAAAQRHVWSVEAQSSLRSMLDANGLVAFVRNGSVLPRRSGQSDLPLQQAASTPSSSSAAAAAAAALCPFVSPPSLQVAFDLPHVGRVEGMGIRKGVTLIVGGGFHGKSTLLTALEVGIYDHIPGDGREFVCCADSSVKIRAEDGRAVTDLDISPFINNLPFARPTDCFSTTCASGSTSQSANILEMLEMGSQCLLMDEDTCATNFMQRDSLMAELVHARQEPITPFLHRARGLWEGCGVSSILVVGGCGAFFAVADSVIMMECFNARDVTAEAKAIAAAHAHETNSGALNMASASATAAASAIFATTFASTRGVVPSSLRLRDGDSLRVKDIGKIQIGRDSMDAEGNTSHLDLTGLEQLRELGQTRAVAEALQSFPGLFGSTASSQAAVSLTRALSELQSRVTGGERGLDALVNNSSLALGDLTFVRKFEIAAAINRWRSLATRNLT